MASKSSWKGEQEGEGGSVVICLVLSSSRQADRTLCHTAILSSSYIPAVVDHRGGMPCHGTFLLHQVFTP